MAEQADPGDSQDKVDGDLRQQMWGEGRPESPTPTLPEQELLLFFLRSSLFGGGSPFIYLFPEGYFLASAWAAL